jgi:hypothetical protein
MDAAYRRVRGSRTSPWPADVSRSHFELDASDLSKGPLSAIRRRSTGRLLSTLQRRYRSVDAHYTNVVEISPSIMGRMMSAPAYQSPEPVSPASASPVLFALNGHAQRCRPHVILLRDSFIAAVRH